MKKALGLAKEFCCIAFIGELVLGFNGKMLIIHNIPIRYILYGLIMIILSISIVKNINYIFQMKTKGLNKGKIKYFINFYFTKFDKILALFLILNFIWIFIIPVFTGTSFKFSIKETLCMNVLVLYFPIVILMKSNIINWEKYRTIVKGSIFILACIHIIFYIGEILVGDATFVLSIFEGIKVFTGGNTIRPKIMMPDSYIRIIYPASLLLIMVYYFCINSKQTIKDMIFLVIGIFALFTTVTKSLFLGVIGGIIVYYSIITYKKIKNKEQLPIGRSIRIICVILLSTIVLNYTLFNNYIFMRISNSFVVATEKSQQDAQRKIDEGIEGEESLNYIKERAGSERANRTRFIQIDKLLDRWKEKPILGWGYGSSAGNYLRSIKETPYSYEMAGVALLMKIGLIGMLMWVSFFGYLIYYILKVLGTKSRDAISVIYIIIALGISSQFNYFLFNSTGMGILLFCFIEMKKIELLRER